jgi:hypothetical protein
LIQKPATNSLPLSPCGRGWIGRSDSERDPGEGFASKKLLYEDNPSPDLARLRLRSVTLAHKGRGKESVLRVRNTSLPILD